MDNASALLHSMSVPNSVSPCAISTVVYLCNRKFGRAVSVSGGLSLTLLTSQEPDASKFRVFRCTIFAKVPDKLCRRLGEKAFRGIMDGYPPDAPGIASETLLHDALRRRYMLCFINTFPPAPPLLLGRRYPDF
jgi:hypothetical protein